MPNNKTFEQLWNEAYVAYLVLANKCGLVITEDQKQLIKKSTLTDKQKEWIERYGGAENGD